MVHELKTWDMFMMDIATGKKTFELRKNDRDFNEGDVLLLQGGDLGGAGMTDHDLTWIPNGKVIEAEVMYVLTGGRFGLKSDYCIMSIKVRNYNF
jgi:hypothetical protein